MAIFLSEMWPKKKFRLRIGRVPRITPSVSAMCLRGFVWWTLSRGREKFGVIRLFYSLSTLCLLFPPLISNLLDRLISFFSRPLDSSIVFYLSLFRDGEALVGASLVFHWDPLLYKKDQLFLSLRKRKDARQNNKKARRWSESKWLLCVRRTKQEDVCKRRNAKGRRQVDSRYGSFVGLSLFCESVVVPSCASWSFPCFRSMSNSAHSLATVNWLGNHKACK